jgi:hypothetical protein
MSEEPIINGIDVSECEHHYTNPVNGIIYHGCAIYEQINELGYSQDTLCEQNPDCYFKQLKRLQEENEELKNRLKTLDDEVLTIEITLDEFERYKKYRQTFEEIRAIAKEATNSKDCYIYMYAGRMYCEPILKKINEVLKCQ